MEYAAELLQADQFGLEQFEAIAAQSGPDDRRLRAELDEGCRVEPGIVLDELNAALKAASEGKMKGVLDYTDQPLVSSDFNHYPASSTIDSLETSVMEGKLARVVSWYDNEWGFSNRMIDTAGVMAKFL